MYDLINTMIGYICVYIYIYKSFSVITNNATHLSAHLSDSFFRTKPWQCNCWVIMLAHIFRFLTHATLTLGRHYKLTFQSAVINIFLLIWNYFLCIKAINPFSHIFQEILPVFLVCLSFHGILKKFHTFLFKLLQFQALVHNINIHL